MPWYSEEQTLSLHNISGIILYQCHSALWLPGSFMQASVLMKARSLAWAGTSSQSGSRPTAQCPDAGWLSHNNGTLLWAPG